MTGRSKWRDGRSRAVAVLACIALAATAVVCATDVATSIDADDRAAIESLGVGNACARIPDLEAQIGCVRAIQSALGARVPDHTCVDERGVTSHEPAAFLERARGCCYDRSRLIEKAASFYGLEVRHVAIYNTRASLDLVRGGVPSHSLSEVRTASGWMTVDSNEETLGLARDRTPLDVVRLGEELRRGGAELEPQDYSQFFGGEYLAIYGLYSRHGGFYVPHLPAPDVDWAQLHHNL